MRSSSVDRLQPRRKESQSRVVPQVCSLSPPKVSEVAKLHSRFKTVVRKLMDFVSISSELLTNPRLPEDSLSTQRKLLDELEQEKNRWEQVMCYSLAVQEDILKPHSQVFQTSSNLDSSDFKRICDLIAETQNKVIIILRQHKEDSNCKVWEAFTQLNQWIYDVFFRQKSVDLKETMLLEKKEIQQKQEEELDQLRKKIREKDLKLVEAKELLKKKDLEIENMRRNVDSRTFHKVQNSLERTQEQISILETENGHFRSESGPGSMQKCVQSSSFILSKKKLGHKSSKIDADLSKSRHMNDQETKRLWNKYDLALRELDKLKALKQKKDDANDRLGFSLTNALGDESDEDMSLQRLNTTSFTNSRSDYFNQLQMKEKECAELTKTMKKLTREMEQLKRGGKDIDLKFQRQQKEVNHFLKLIKSLEEEKKEAETLGEQFRLEKLRTEHEISVLKTQFYDVQDAEEIMKKLKLTIEEKQKVSHALNQAKIDLTKATEHGIDLTLLRSEAEKSLETALIENNRLESKVKSLEKAGINESKQQRKQLEALISSLRQGLEHQYNETVIKVDTQETKLANLQRKFESRLRKHREMLNEIVPKYEEKCENLQKELNLTSENAVEFESLFRQTQKDNEFLSSLMKKIETDLDAIQIESKRKDAKIEFLSQNLKKIETQYRDLESNLYETSTQRTTLETEIEETNKETTLLKEELQRLVDKVTQAKNEIEDLERSVSNENMQKLDAEKRAKSLEVDIEEMRRSLDYKEKQATELSEMQGKLTKSVAENRKKDKEIAGVLLEKGKLQENFDRETAANAELLQKLKSAFSIGEKSVLELQEAKSRLETQVSDLQKEAKNMNEVIGELRSELNAHSTELIKKEKSILELKTTAENEKRVYERLYTQFQEANGKHQATSLELKKKHEEGEGLNSQLHRSEEEVGKLKDQLSSLSSKVEMYKKQAQENDRLRREAEERFHTFQSQLESQFSIQIEALQNQLILDSDKARSLEAKIAQIQTEKAAEIYDLKKQLGEKEKDLKEFVQKREREKTDFEGKLNAERSVKKGLSEENETLEKKLKRFTTENDRINSEKSFLESEITRLTIELEARNEIEEALETQIRAKEELISEMNANTSQLQCEIRRLHGQLDQQTALFQQQKAALDKPSQEDLQTYAQDIDELKEENSRLEKQLADTLMRSEENNSLYQNFRSSAKTTDSEVEKSTLREEIENLGEVLGVSGDEEQVRNVLKRWKTAEIHLDLIYKRFCTDSETRNPTVILTLFDNLQLQIDQITQEKDTREQRLREVSDSLESEQKNAANLARKLKLQIEENQVISNALKSAESVRVSTVNQLESEQETKISALNQKHVSALKSLQDSLNQAKAQNVDLEAKYASLESLKTTLEHETTRLSSELIAVVKNFEALHRQLENAKESAVQQSVKIAEMINILEEKERELHIQKLQVAHLKEEIETQRKERKSEKDAFLNKIQALTEEINTLKLAEMKIDEFEDYKDAQIALLTTKIEELSEANSQILMHWHEEKQSLFDLTKQTFETELLNRESSFKSIYQNIENRLFSLNTSLEKILPLTISALKHISAKRKNELFSQPQDYEALAKTVVEITETMATKEFDEVETKIFTLNSKAEAVFSQCAAALRIWRQHTVNEETRLVDFILETENKTKSEVESKLLALYEQKDADLEHISAIISEKLSEFDDKLSAVWMKFRELREQVVKERQRHQEEISNLTLILSEVQQVVEDHTTSYV